MGLIGKDHPEEERRRASCWGTIPPSQLRLPLQLRGGSDTPARLIDPVRTAHPDRPGATTAAPLEDVDLEASPPAGLLDALEEAEAEEPEAAGAEDPIARYLKEIGKAKLLTGGQEVEIGKRIEDGQAELRRQLAAVPLALRSVTDLSARVRAHTIPIDDLIVFPEGEPTPAEVRAVVTALGRLTRLAAMPSARRRGRGAPVERGRLADMVAALRLKPAIMENLVLELERVDQQFEALEAEPRAARAPRELRALEAGVGLSRADILERLSGIRVQDRLVREVKRRMI